MTEAEMCAEFTRRARAVGWNVYPETGGFDLLMVWGGEAPIPHSFDTRNAGDEKFWDSDWISDYEEAAEFLPGDQVGVEAKMRPGLPVLAQLLNRYCYHHGPNRKGPDFFAILTPRGKLSADMETVCKALGIGVYGFDAKAENETILFPRHRHKFPGGHLWTPPVEPSFHGGHPAPKKLSHWRVGALEIMALLRSRGWVSGEDFKSRGIHRGAWLTRQWVAGYWEGKERRYRMVQECDLKHPRKGMWDFPDAGYESEMDSLTKNMEREESKKQI